MHPHNCWVLHSGDRKLTIEQLGSIGELLAAIATLATLVYLAIQVRQAKRQIADSLIQARANFSNEAARYAGDIQLRWFSPTGQNPTMMKALLTQDRLTPEEAYEFAVQMPIFIGELIRTEMLSRRDLLDEEYRHVRRSIFRPYLAMPRVRKWWEKTGRDFYSYDQEGCRVVEQLIAEVDGGLGLNDS